MKHTVRFGRMIVKEQVVLMILCAFCGCLHVGNRQAETLPLADGGRGSFQFIVKFVPDGDVSRYIDRWLNVTFGIEKASSGELGVEAIRAYARQVDWWSSHIALRDEVFVERFAHLADLRVEKSYQAKGDVLKMLTKSYRSVNRMIALASVRLPGISGTPFDQLVDDIQRQASKDLMNLRLFYDFYTFFVQYGQTESHLASRCDQAGNPDDTKAFTSIRLPSVTYTNATLLECAGNYADFAERQLTGTCQFQKSGTGFPHVVFIMKQDYLERKRTVSIPESCVSNALSHIAESYGVKVRRDGTAGYFLFYDGKE